MDLRQGENKKVKRVMIQDQPVFFVIFFGCILVFILGLSVRAYFSPEFIRSESLKAAQKIHPNIKAQIDEASFVLADGWMPRFAIQLKNITLESEDKCLLSPIIHADYVRLPISVMSLIKKQPRIEKIQIENFIVKIRNSNKDCPKFVSTADQENVDRKTSSASEGERSEAKSVKTQINNIVDTLEVKNFHLYYLPKDNYHMALKDVFVKMSSIDRRLLMKAVFIHQYPSDIELEIEDSKSPRARLLASGYMNEGSYKAQINYEHKNKNIDLSVVANQLPLTHIVALAKKNKLTQMTLNGKSNWISFDVRANGNLKDIKKAKLKILGFKLEGDVGEVFADQIDLTYFDPVRFNPFEAQIKNLSLDRFVHLLNRDRVISSINSLGFFNGTAQVKSRREIIVTGENQGLEFIFANLGKREIQRVSKIKGEIDFVNEKWKVLVDELKLDQGVFAGDLLIHADKSWRDVDISLKLDELLLSQRVQKLIAGRGELGRFSGNLKIGIESSKLTQIDGKFKSDQININDNIFEDSTFDFSHIDKKIVVQMRSNKVRVEKNSPLYPHMSDLFEFGDSFEFKQLQTKFTTQNLNWLEWQYLKASSQDLSFNSNGSWDEAGNLSGSFDVKNKNKLLKYKILGTRQTPQFVKE